MRHDGCCAARAAQAEHSRHHRQTTGGECMEQLLAVVVIAAAAGFAWQTYSDDQTKVMVKALWSSVHGVKLNPGSELAANDTPQLTDQTAAVAQSPPTPAVGEALLSYCNNCRR
jgi:hypothetical protein